MVDGKRKNSWRSLGLYEGAPEEEMQKALRKVRREFVNELDAMIDPFIREICNMSVYEYMQFWYSRAKRKMKYLLENGYIPYIDTGKRTHQYIVKISDAEQFKIKLENDAVLAISLEGRFGNKKTNDKQMVSEQESEEFKKYLHKKWKSEPDAMPTKKVAQLTGYAPQRIIVLCEKKEIFSIKLQSKLYCSKQSVINYFGSVKMMGKPKATKGYSNLIGEYKQSIEKV